MRPFTDNPDKRVVREMWDTPILRFLHETYGARYRYMGLPGVDLIDIKLWKDMIDEVVAFEPPDKSDSRRDSIISLRRNLKLLDVPGTAYFGSLEEVVTLRKDFDGTPYSQEKLVTLYNFDFCDEISSAINTRQGGRKVLRFEAIRQVLHDQVNCYQGTAGPNYFLFMLTIRNQMDAAKLASFLKKPLLAEVKRFRDDCSQLNQLPARGPLIGSHFWGLKTFLYNLLCQYFVSPNLSAVLLPLVAYQGTRVSRSLLSPMLHWIILCKFGSPENETPDLFPPAFLTRCSVRVKRSGLEWQAETGEHQTPSGLPNPVTLLRDHGSALLRELSVP